MRIINKKYLLIIILVGVILIGVVVLKSKEKVKLDNVILKQEINSKTFAMYKEEGNDYVPVEGTEFPKGYVLNLTESKCIDNNGNEIKDALNYENDKVVLTTNKSSYCYLYFDKSLGLEIKDEAPNGLKTDKERGEMYRFQGQQSDEIENYICFGTSDKDTCVKDTNHYMYRIIGIQASTGRVKVIKKEALENEISWWDDDDDDIEFPDSNIYKAINGSDFLENTNYVPVDEEKNINWKEKIVNNIWVYGDMLSNDTMGARQIGEELYLAETGQKETIWDAKAREGDYEAQSVVITSKYSPYIGKTIYYVRHSDEKWTKNFNSKVSLMYLHDYYLAVNDDANCQFDEKKYDCCKSGWLHLSNNDVEVQENGEWTMNRLGWTTWAGFFIGAYIYNTGGTSTGALSADLLVRPVFYISASEKLLGGEGTIDNPFIIS